MAIKKKIIDFPNERSSHTVPTPRGGGIAVAIVWFITLGYILIKRNFTDNVLIYALGTGIILAVVGIIDDIYNISSGIRFLAQILASIIALTYLGGLNKVDLGFYVFENTWVLTPIAFFAILWFINVFNFLDGIDGYLGSELLFITLSAGFLFSSGLNIILGIIVLGFLVVNWPKAKIFMGDVGSTLSGFTIAVFAIYFQNTSISSIFIWIMLSSLFWFDATYSCTAVT